MTNASPKVNSNSETWPSRCSAAKAEPLDRRADRADGDRRDDEPGPEADAPLDLEAEVGAEHVEAHMGEVEHPHHAEHKREPACQHEEQHAVQDAVQRRERDDLQHWTPTRPF